MVSSSLVEEVQSLRINKNILVNAPLDITFEAVLADLGPESEMAEGMPFPMVLEAWPGGRWYRDLGNNAGHLWGHVQVIKPPKLIEICGPMFMSYAATSHIQYRLAEEEQGTRVSILHTAIGLISAEHSEGVQEGWQHCLEHLKCIAERKTSR
ncbi:MAG: SRPBCC domain-containing protein [Planctomycetota bacterium]|nr:SRPBCC domain-containing protein [Planctomycetota bacterium]